MALPSVARHIEHRAIKSVLVIPCKVVSIVVDESCA
jgi:hypothetical protein